MSFDPQAKADTTCVRFTLRLDDGRSDVAISAKALVECFGADMTPEGLLESYRENASAIHDAARHKGRPTSDGGVLLTAGDLGEWEAHGRRTARAQRREAARGHLRGGALAQW